MCFLILSKIKYFQTVHSLQFQLQSSFVEDRCPSSQESSSSKSSMGIPPPPLSVLGSPSCQFSLEGVSHCRPVVSLQNSIRAIGSHFQLFLPFPPQLPSPGSQGSFGGTRGVGKGSLPEELSFLQQATTPANSLAGHYPFLLKVLLCHNPSR